MAYGIARTIMRRAEQWGRAQTSDELSSPLLQPFGDPARARDDLHELERPPIAALSLRARAPEAMTGERPFAYRFRFGNQRFAFARAPRVDQRLDLFGAWSFVLARDGRRARRVGHERSHTPSFGVSRPY
jgi:hypothetical protein